MEVEWVRRWLRRRVLLRRLAVSDACYDRLSVQYDQLNALNELLGGKIAVEEIAAMCAQLEIQGEQQEVIYAPIEDELRQLESASVSRWLTNHFVDLSTWLLIAIAITLRATRHAIRKVRLFKKQLTKTPAPPGDDESSDFLTRRCGSNYILSVFISS